MARAFPQQSCVSGCGWLAKKKEEKPFKVFFSSIFYIFFRTFSECMWMPGQTNEKKPFKSYFLPLQICNFFSDFSEWMWMPDQKKEEKQYEVTFFFHFFIIVLLTFFRVDIDAWPKKEDKPFKVICYQKEFICICFQKKSEWMWIWPKK